MAAQYDAFAELYQRTKQAPLREHIEAFTLMRLIGDVRGARVLDLACGEGFYSRRLKRAGADLVVGVDISPAMIRLADQQERDCPLGVRYLCANAAELEDLGQFDIVTAAYLLHYARDAQELGAMAQRIAAQLPAGGRFVSLNENPAQSAAQHAGYDRYGFNKTAVVPLTDGAEITYWFVTGREHFQIQLHYFSTATYERALREAGFVDLAWHPLQLDPAGIAQHGAGYWQEYLLNPPIVGLECRRG